jgi:hypothetical protein
MRDDFAGLFPEVCEAEADAMRALAQALRRPGPAPAAPRRPQTVVAVAVSESDARAAGGPALVERTVAASIDAAEPDARAKAADVIAALKSIAPRTAVEGGLAGLFVALERMAFDCLRVARVAGFDTQMGALMLARAEKAACRAIEAADAISRQRYRGQQTVRVEHVHVHEGGQAVIGAVAAGGGVGGGR